MPELYFRISNFIRSSLYLPFVGFVLGILISIFPQITLARLYSYFSHLCSSEPALLAPPGYSSLSSTTAIIVAAIFPVAIYIMGKKKDVEYIEKKMSEFFKDEHIAEIDILDCVEKNKEEILTQYRALIIGSIVFALVSLFPSLVAGMLFSLWKGPCLLLDENHAIAIHIICFSFFCSAIGAVYIEEFGFKFYRSVFMYTNFFKNKKRFDNFLKRISRVSKKNLKNVDLGKFSEINDYNHDSEATNSSSEWIFILIFNEVIITFYCLIVKNILEDNKILTLHQVFLFISSIAIALFLCCFFIKFLDSKYYERDKSIKKYISFLGFLLWAAIFASSILSYDTMHLLGFLLSIFLAALFDFVIKELFIYGSISGRIYYLWFLPLVCSLFKFVALVLSYSDADLHHPYKPAFNFEIFLLSIFVLIVGILIDLIVGYPYKNRQGLVLCELMNSRSENIYILSSKLDRRFIDLLNNYIEKNEKYKEEIEDWWHSRLESKEKL